MDSRESPRLRSGDRTLSAAPANGQRKRTATAPLTPTTPVRGKSEKPKSGATMAEVQELVGEVDEYVSKVCEQRRTMPSIISNLVQKRLEKEMERLTIPIEVNGAPPPINVDDEIAKISEALIDAENRREAMRVAEMKSLELEKKLAERRQVLEKLHAFLNDDDYAPVDCPHIPGVL